MKQGLLKANESRPVAATLNPGQFILRSTHSRAAVRSMLLTRSGVKSEEMIFRVRLVGKALDPGKRCACKLPAAGTFSLCRCFL